MINIEKTLFSTSQQKILAFLSDNPEEEFTEKEISTKTGVKKSAVNLALRKLADEGIITRKKIGRSSLSKAESRNILIREIKIVRNILKISPLVSKLSKISNKIIFFGSIANGTNKADSDIDIFVLASNPKAVRHVANDSPFSEKLQLICKTPTEMIQINKKKPLLFSEIEKGRVLWEKNE